MSTQYRLVQSGKTSSGGCSAGPRFVRACSATDLFILNSFFINATWIDSGTIPGFRDDTPATNRLSYGTAEILTESSFAVQANFGFK
jgi:hypothetical protein